MTQMATGCLRMVKLDIPIVTKNKMGYHKKSVGPSRVQVFPGESDLLLSPMQKDGKDVTKNTAVVNFN